MGSRLGLEMVVEEALDEIAHSLKQIGFQSGRLTGIGREGAQGGGGVQDIQGQGPDAAPSGACFGGTSAA